MSNNDPLSNHDDLKAEAIHEDIERCAQLTPQERVLEKKLRLKIDMLVMPIIILVYLMNYIDRLVPYPPYSYLIDLSKFECKFDMSFI